MNKKINLDRKKLDSEYIASKQDFKKVLHLTKTTPLPTWKSYWFYGAVGLASIALVVGITFYPPNSNALQQKETAISQASFSNVIEEQLPDDNISFGISVSGDNSIKKDKSIEQLEKKDGASKSTENKQFTASSASETSVNKDKPELVESTEPVKYQRAERNKNTNTPPKMVLPNIAGVYNGELELSKLCDKMEVAVNRSNLTVTNFKIQYAAYGGDKAIDVDGDKLPEAVCSDIKEYGIDQMIFITDIYAKNREGRKETLTSMNFTVVID